MSIQQIPHVSIISGSANPLSENSAKKIKSALSRISELSVVKSSQDTLQIVSTARETFINMRTACSSAHLSRVQPANEQLMAHHTLELANIAGRLNTAAEQLEKLSVQMNALQQAGTPADINLIERSAETAAEFIIALMDLGKCNVEMEGFIQTIASPQQQQSSGYLSSAILTASSLIQSIPLIGKSAIAITCLSSFVAAAPVPGNKNGVDYGSWENAFLAGDTWFSGWGIRFIMAAFQEVYWALSNKDFERGSNTTLAEGLGRNAGDFINGAANNLSATHKEEAGKFIDDRFSHIAFEIAWRAAFLIAEIGGVAALLIFLAPRLARWGGTGELVADAVGKSIDRGMTRLSDKKNLKKLKPILDETVAVLLSKKNMKKFNIAAQQISGVILDEFFAQHKNIEGLTSNVMDDLLTLTEKHISALAQRFLKWADAEQLADIFTPMIEQLQTTLMGDPGITAREHVLDIQYASSSNNHIEVNQRWTQMMGANQQDVPQEELDGVKSLRQLATTILTERAAQNRTKQKSDGMRKTLEKLSDVELQIIRDINDDNIEAIAKTIVMHEASRYPDHLAGLGGHVPPQTQLERSQVGQFFMRSAATIGDSMGTHARHIGIAGVDRTLGAFIPGYNWLRGINNGSIVTGAVTMRGSQLAEYAQKKVRDIQDFAQASAESDDDDSFHSLSESQNDIRAEAVLPTTSTMLNAKKTTEHRRWQHQQARAASDASSSDSDEEIRAEPRRSRFTRARETRRGDTQLELQSIRIDRTSNA